MGSASSVIVERMSSPVVIDFWKKLVEGASQMDQISFGEKKSQNKQTMVISVDFFWNSSIYRLLVWLTQNQYIKMFCKQPTELESSKKENGETGSYRGVMYASCLDIVMNFIVLVSYLLEDSIRLRMHLFAQVYVTELQAEKIEKLSILPVLHGQQFIFHHLRCCMRYHVLLELLEKLQMSKVSMIEIGVHRASTAKYLLHRAPFLHWTGIDPYTDYRKGSGDLADRFVLSFFSCIFVLGGFQEWSCCKSKILTNVDDNFRGEICGFT